MREMIFRGFHEDKDGKEKAFYGGEWHNGEWVEGSFIPYGHKCIITDRNPLTDSKTAVLITVAPDTVGQYIGAEDKNRKMIFEGDIVRFEQITPLGYLRVRNGEVKYYTELPIFYVLSETGDAWDWCDLKNIEVIGNIYNNPELLKGEQE